MIELDKWAVSNDYIASSEISGIREKMLIVLNQDIFFCDSDTSVEEGMLPSLTTASTETQCFSSNRDYLSECNCKSKHQTAYFKLPDNAI
uniref:Ovule protein n=1 Tax=Heterorhabditis bacteriophora TaxID=37862 RepID=A0A1I7WLF2_HETBA